jgi:hypothetical protein
MTADLDRAAFAAWLRAQPPEAVVGWPGTRRVWGLEAADHDQP